MSYASISKLIAAIHVSAQSEQHEDHAPTRNNDDDSDGKKGQTWVTGPRPIHEL